MTTIAERQNAPVALRAAKAFRRRYRVAKFWHTLRGGGGILLGTVGVFIALIKPSTADGIAAAAAGWAFVGRLLLVELERHFQGDGALGQEVFDTYVLQVGWNAAAAGDPPVAEDLINWGARQTEDGLRDWYPDTSEAIPPLDALICQRASLTWARQDHQTYALILRVVAIAAFCVTLILGAALKLSVGDYMLRLAVPMLPGVLDILDLARANSELGTRRKQAEQLALAMYSNARDTAVAPTVAECRSLQDEIYRSRRVIGPPSWFYFLKRSARQINMEQVADEQVTALPATLKKDQTSALVRR